MTDDDRALLVLYSSKQESLKASSTSALIGKKRKEATATEIRAYQKQFLEAKQLKWRCCRSGVASRSDKFSVVQQGQVSPKFLVIRSRIHSLTFVLALGISRANRRSSSLLCLLHLTLMCMCLLFKRSP